ncbi:hypothetical protein IEQ34_018469 [Dendrobium chrysotoxum]|uniref:RING-type domain-containing protein n=1 Tax=Dendrobium chrysotoxum TaxID=161865 RepID=A0AAV7FNH1_DENCH|nr:hypothetical protein IEQ34_018469 [Dendrobium chrysotoxum]
MTITVLFLITAITFIFYLFYFRSTAPPPLQPGTTADRCSICLVDYADEEEREDNQIRILPDCGHVFHAICVGEWLRNNPTCPICRSSVMLG